MTVSAPVRPRQDHQPQHRDSRPRQHPTLRPWGVVLIWAALLAVLAATGAGFGNSVPVLEISGSSAALVLLIAAAVWLDRRLRPGRWYFRQPTRIGGVVMLAVAAALAWAGFAFGAWLMMIAAVPFAAAVGLEISARRYRKALEAAGDVRGGPYPAVPAAALPPPAPGRPARTASGPVTASGNCCPAGGGEPYGGAWPPPPSPRRGPLSLRPRR